MSKFSILACIAICDAIIVKMVYAKVVLCQPAPKWTVDNGSDPMYNAYGNVTLVTLISADHRFGLQQAQSMENMLQFLTSTGLKEFQFIIINSKQFNARSQFNELSAKVSFPVYQETDEENVWDVIDGGKDDMFIYDRCGLLTYYIPFPLSIIHAQQPILQAALLSTYFDNPCGESCDELILDSDTITTTSTLAPIDSTTDSRTYANLTANDTVLEGLQGLQDLEPSYNVSTPSDFKLYQVFLDHRNQTNDSIVVEVEVDGSGSGDSDDSGLEYNATLNGSAFINSTINDSLSQQQIQALNESSKEQPSSNMFVDLPWKIFSFFADKKNRSDDEIYDEIYNASKSELNGIEVNASTYESLSTTTTTATTTTTTMITTTSTIIADIVNQTSTTPILSTTLSLPTTSKTRTRPRARPTTSVPLKYCNEYTCYEWSTDKLLRARLCCLSVESLGSDEESGFGCRGFTKDRCKSMLPLITCCLRNFSKLIENYFKGFPRDTAKRRRTRTRSILGF